jgi:hypothetical protein
MATPRKSVSTKRPGGETRLKRRWLSTFAIVVPIIVAIIGAVAHFSGAFIQRTDQKPKLSEPTKIEQQTHGSGSPAIGQAGGNVTIQQQVGGKKK